MIDNEKAVLLAVEANRKRAMDIMNNELVQKAFDEIDKAAREGYYSVDVKGAYRRDHIHAIEWMGFYVTDITEGGKDTNEINISWATI